MQLQIFERGVSEDHYGWKMLEALAECRELSRECQLKLAAYQAEQAENQLFTWALLKREDLVAEAQLALINWELKRKSKSSSPLYLLAKNPYLKPEYQGLLIGLDWHVDMVLLQRADLTASAAERLMEDRVFILCMTSPSAEVQRIVLKKANYLSQLSMAENALLAEEIQEEIATAEGSDTEIRAAMAKNTSVLPVTIDRLFSDPSPKVLFNLLKNEKLDEDRRVQGWNKLVYSTNHSARRLAAGSESLGDPWRDVLLHDAGWVVLTRMARREDLSPSERMALSANWHAGVRRAFATREDLSVGEIELLLADERRGVVAAVSFNEKVAKAYRTEGLKRLEQMPTEAPQLRRILTPSHSVGAPIDPNLPVLGFRTWEWRADTVLASFWRDEVWESKFKRALCPDPVTANLRFESDVPHPHPHSCGIYAKHRMEDLELGSIVGAVLGSGHIQIHQEGWRAQEVEIVALATRSLLSSRIEATDAVGSILGVPVLSKDGLETYARHFGQTVTKSGAEAWMAQEDQGLKNVWGLE